LIMGKVSYEDKAWIRTLWGLGFGYQTTVANIGEKVGSSPR